MLQRHTLRRLPMIFYDTALFWKNYSSAEERSGKSYAVLFIILTVISALAGIAGRYIYAISSPSPVDILPEAVSNLFTPVIVLFSLSLLTWPVIKKNINCSFSYSVSFSAVSMMPYIAISVIILLVRDLFFFGLLGLFSAFVYARGLEIFVKTGNKTAVRLSVVVLLVILLIHFFTDLLLRYITVNIISNA